MISERKIDDSFPIGYFLIDGFCVSYRLDRNSKGGGILGGHSFKINYSRYKSNRELLC